MKQIVLFLLISTSIFAQNPTKFEKVRITSNTTSTTATKVNVQETDGTVNTIAKSDLIEYLEYASAVNLPVTGLEGKIYLTRDNNTLYRWNGTIYAPLSQALTGAENKIPKFGSGGLSNSQLSDNGTKVELYNSTITPQFGIGLKSTFFNTNSEGIKTIQDWQDGSGNVRVSIGDVNNSIAGTALKLIGTQGRGEMVELALMQTNTLPRDYGTTLTTQPTTSNFQIGIRNNNVESVALEIDNSNNKLTYKPKIGGMFSINADGFSPMLTMYNNGGVSEWAIYQGQNPFDDDLHLATKISSSFSDKLKIRQDGITEGFGFKIFSISSPYLLKNGGVSSFLYDSGTMLGVGRTDPTRIVDILAGAGVSPFRAVGVNGNILIDNSGLGINYFSANDSQIFQINGVEKMKINTSGVVSFTEIPTAPTATAGTNTTQIATTAFVNASLGGTVNTLLKKTASGVLGNSNISDNGTIISLNADSNFTGSATFQDIIISNNRLRLKAYTVSTLPVGTQGDTAYVTDATAPTYLGALIGGGAIKCPVFYNGTIWVSH